MKKMYKLASLLLTFTLLFGMLGLTARAEEDDYIDWEAIDGDVVPISAPIVHYEKLADILNGLGLFLGTPSGYQLERAPNRAEAAVMLVRLLGVENEVKAGTYEHPFTDVPDWADKQVGYMYENGLTKGTSASLYSSFLPCEAKMYVTFMLRALGRAEDEGIGFTYDTAVTDAVEHLLLDTGLAAGLANKEFLRDDMVAVSFCALTAGVDGVGGIRLIDKLVDDGAVAPDKAAACEDEFGAYAAYRKAALLNARATDLDASMIMNINMDAYGTKMNEHAEISIQAEGMDDPETAKMKMELSVKGHSVSPTTTTDMEMSMAAYLKDGWLYLSVDTLNADTVKQKADMHPLFEELAGVFSTQTQSLILGLSPSNILTADLMSFTETDDGATAVYDLGVPFTVKYDNEGRLMEMTIIQDTSSDMDEFALDMTMDVAYTYNYPEGGVKVDLSGLVESDFTEVSFEDLGGNLLGGSTLSGLLVFALSSTTITTESYGDAVD